MSRRISRVELWMQVKDHKKFARVMLINGVTHRQVAEEAGWKSHSIVTRIAKGEITTITPDRAILIEKFLEVEPQSLFVPMVPNNSAQDALPKRSRKATAA